MLERASFLQQNTIFPHSHHHWLYISTSGEQERTCCAYKRVSSILSCYLTSKVGVGDMAVEVKTYYQLSIIFLALLQITQSGKMASNIKTERYQ